MQVLINKFSCATEVYKIAIKRWRIAGAPLADFLLRSARLNFSARFWRTPADAGCRTPQHPLLQHKMAEALGSHDFTSALRPEALRLLEGATG